MDIIFFTWLIFALYDILQMEVTPSRLGIFFTWVIVFNLGTTDQNIIYGCIATLIFIFMPKLFQTLTQKN